MTRTVKLSYLICVPAFSLTLLAASPPHYRELVASYNPEARTAAMGILDAGGNAFDAFVAATAVEYVVSPGATSAAGTLAAMIYDSESQTTQFLDATPNAPMNPNGNWQKDAPDGKGVVIPGGIAGLEAIENRYGQLGLRRCLEPAIRLAREGFAITENYTGLIKFRRKILKRSAYGRRTYFKDGKPIAGMMKLPEVANFLEKVAEYGSSYMYEGEWAHHFVQKVNAYGGHVSLEDLSNYHALWMEPRYARHAGYDIAYAAGRNYGSAWQILGLKTLEHARLNTSRHYSTYAPDLEKIVRIARAVGWEYWLMNPEWLDDEERLASRLTYQYANSLWKKVKERREDFLPVQQTGTHSYHVIVVDRKGNVITGTNSILSFAWADGIFVEGIPLTNVGKLGVAPRPGERVLSPLATNMAFKDGKLMMASGSFNFALKEAGLQYLINVLNYHLDGESAAQLPRFGTSPLDQYDSGGGQDISSTWIDPRIDQSVVSEAEAHGLKFNDSDPDTGSGAVVVREPDGSWSAGMSELDIDGIDNRILGRETEHDCASDLDISE